MWWRGLISKTNAWILHFLYLSLLPLVLRRLFVHSEIIWAVNVFDSYPYLLTLKICAKTGVQNVKCYMTMWQLFKRPYMLLKRQKRKHIFTLTLQDICLHRFNENSNQLSAVYNWGKELMTSQVLTNLHDYFKCRWCCMSYFKRCGCLFLLISLLLVSFTAQQHTIGHKVPKIRLNV